MTEFKNKMKYVSEKGVTYELSRWTKNGNDRLYVNPVANKKGCGYIDLLTMDYSNVGFTSFDDTDRIAHLKKFIDTLKF